MLHPNYHTTKFCILCKTKIRLKCKLCFIDTHSYIVHVKADDIYKDIAEDLETRFDTSDFELDRSFTEEINKKVIELIKDELGGKNHEKICWIKIRKIERAI